MKIFVIIFFCISSLNLFSQSNSLWVDSNPYSTGTQGLQVGAIVRVLLKDGIKAEYVYESGKDDTITIKSSPDKKSIPEIMGYNMDRTIAGKKNGKEKSNSKIVGSMAAQVIGLDPAGNLIITGSREATYDTGKSSLKLTGKVAGGDIKDGNAIESDKVAELKLEYIASPIEKNLKDPDLQLKPALDPKGKPIIGPDGQPVLKSEITETERQKIILKNIKRLLGESE
jgi:flagellar L-ring protein precursor FlgH